MYSGTPSSSGLLKFAFPWVARVCVPVLGCGFPVRNVFVAYLFRGMYLYDELFLGLWVLHGAPRSSGLLVSALSWVARVCVSRPVLGCGSPVCNNHPQTDGGPYGLGLLITLGPFGLRNPTRCGGTGVVMRRSARLAVALNVVCVCVRVCVCVCVCVCVLKKLNYISLLLTNVVV